MTAQVTTSAELTPALATAVRALAADAASVDGVPALSEQTLLHLIAPPGQHRHVLALEDETLVGYAHLDHTGVDAGAELVVAPARRRRGLATHLWGEVTSLVPDARVWAHGDLEPAQAWARARRLVVVRELHRMARPLAGLESADIVLPPGYSARTFASDDIGAWVALNARAFASHPEQGRVTAEDVRARMSEPWFDPEGFFLIDAPSTGSGERTLAAFHWTKTADGEGEVYVVGVDPDRQGLGLGKAATLLGLRHLARRGLPRVTLYVDGDNTAALATYRRLGFDGLSLDVMYEPARHLRRAPTGSRVIRSCASPCGRGVRQARAACHHVGMTATSDHSSPAQTPRGDQDNPVSAVTGETSSVARPRAANGRFLPADSGDELPADRFLDREISWLQFNERVLQLAADPDMYLLERARFLSIFASNLDEFFMVRVAGLKRRIATGLAVRSASGLEPRELLDRILSTAQHLMATHARIFDEQVRPALAEEGILIVGWDDLSDDERGRLDSWFAEQVFPVLTPLAVDPAHPFPYISGLSLNLAVVLENRKTGTEHFARLKVPPLLPRLVRISEPEGDAELYTARFVPVEEVIAAHLDELFPGMIVREHFTFRVTRNEDLEVEEDDAENLLAALEKELTRRRFGPAVRLEIEDRMDDHVLDLLVRELGVAPREVFRCPTPLDLRCLGAVADLDRTELRYPPFVPMTHRDLKRVDTAKAADMFSAIRAKDVLVQHPYDSFSTSVQAFIEQAAADPRVVAIKQTLYRTSGDSPIIDALISAAEAGKQVLAVVEIKARFDEQNNIDWARKLEHAGVHVVYGVVGLKTHCKLSLVIRQETGGLRRYCHVGTGNYHPKTARLYEDFGLFTCDPHVGEDLTKLFNQLSGWAPRSKFARLLVAPASIRSGLVDRIEEQIKLAGKGQDAYIGIKVNSIVDESIIDSLYRASQAGVRVDVLVRGICALRPGVEGLSENLHVRSVLGRFLEHSRIFVFGPEGRDGVYIGSADMMHRNLDRRVEALVRITDSGHVKDLVNVLRRGMSDDYSSFHLRGDGRWTRRHRSDTGEPLLDLQSVLIEEHAARRRGRRG